MKKRPEWFRWLYLAMAVFAPFCGWMDFRNYQYYHAHGAFSEEGWTEIVAGFQFRWAILGLMSVGYLYLFLILTWDKSSSRDHKLLDMIVSTAMLLFWGGLPLLVPLHSSMHGIWGLILIVAVVIVGRSWVTYFENKRLEEIYYE